MGLIIARVWSFLPQSCSTFQEPHRRPRQLIWAALRAAVPAGDLPHYWTLWKLAAELGAEWRGIDVERRAELLETCLRPLGLPKAMEAGVKESLITAKHRLLMAALS